MLKERWTLPAAIGAAALCLLPHLAWGASEEPEPPTPGALSLQGGLSLVWLPPSPAGATPEPATVNVYVVSYAAGEEITLPAKKKATAAGAPDTPASCKWSKSRGDCVSCPEDGDYYLDATAAAALPSVKVLTVESQAGWIVVSSLTPGYYSAFLQYAPMGTITSSCTPSSVY